MAPIFIPLLGINSSRFVYKILSADALKNDPKAMCIVQSDASGTDGYGYYFSYLRDDRREYVSKRWVPPLSPTTTSHTFELKALSDFLQNRCVARNAVLVWLTDNEGATWSINKGSCHELDALPILSNILELCDQYQLQILALWVPRESNLLADYLSHLATLLNRDEVSGHL
jgi:hypothetical protein